MPYGEHSDCFHGGREIFGSDVLFFGSRFELYIEMYYFLRADSLYPIGYTICWGTRPARGTSSGNIAFPCLISCLGRWTHWHAVLCELWDLEQGGSTSPVVVKLVGTWQ
jgi:hypothetical protein